MDLRTEELNVLIIEDREVDAAIIVWRTRRALPGARTRVCSTLGEALEYAARQHPDLIITDLGLPDSEGIGTLRALTDHAAECTVVVVTGTRPDEAARLKAIELGIQDVMSKDDLSDTTLRAGLCYSIQRKRVELESRRLARIDPLTGLLNRRAVLDTLDDLVQRGPRANPIVVALVDLNKFKMINDTFGHGVGDAVLIESAKRMARAADHCGMAIGRLGGDEFCMVGRVPAVDGGCGRAEAMLETLCGEPFTVADRSLDISASIGVASDHRPLTARQLLADADHALYAAKRDPKRRVVPHDSEMAAKISREARMERDLRATIRELGSELTVHYQPVVRMDDRLPVAYESLVRWQHPTEGLLNPAAFIPMAEERGLITELDLWVLRQACQVLSAARAGGNPMRLHVNFSPSVFVSSRHVVREMLEVIDAYQIQPGELVIELTEQALIQDTLDVYQRLIPLLDRGVELALDDFGTGYSSLSYLQNLKVDWLKIDRSFVVERSIDLIEIVTMLAARLELKVIAEGIQSAEEHAMLLRLGVPFGQGNYYGEPVAMTTRELSSPAAAVSPSRRRTD